jgi:hypothetical protein
MGDGSLVRWGLQIADDGVGPGWRPQRGGKQLDSGAVSKVAKS